MERRGGRGAKIAALILVALAILVLIALVSVRLYFTEERTRERVEREASEAVAGEIEVGDFSWRVFPGSGVIEDLRVLDPEGRVVLAVDRAVVSIDPGPLLRRTIHVSSLQVDGVLVRLIETEPEGYTLAQALAPAEEPVEPGPGWDVVVDGADVRGARLEWETEAGVVIVEDLVVEDMSLRWENGELRVEIGATAGEARLPLGERELVARDISVRGLELWTPAEDEAPVATVEAISARSLEVDGVTASLTSAAGSYRDEVARIDEALIDLAPGSLRLAGSLDLSGPSPALELDARLENVRPAPLAEPWIDPALLPRRVDGELSLALARLDDPRGTVFATLNLTGLPAAVAEALPPAAVAELPGAGVLRAQAALVDEGLRLDSLNLRAGDISLSASGLVPADDGPLALSFEVEHAGPAPLLRALDAPFGAGEITLSGELSGTLPLPDARAMLQAAGVTIEPLPPALLRAPLRLERGVLFADDARLSSDAGLLVVRGSIDILDEDGALREDPPLSAALTLRGLDAAALDQWDLARGTLDGRATVRGTLESPVAEGRLTSDDLSLAGVELALARAELRVDLQELNLTDLELVPAAGGRVSGTGALDLRDETMDLELLIADLPAEILAAPFDEPPEVEGTVDGRLSLRGSIDEPVVEFTAEVESLVLAGAPLGDVGVDASGDLDEMALSLSAEGEAGALRAEGTVLPRRREMETLLVEGEDIVVERLPFVEDLPVAVSGVSELAIVAEGPFLQPAVRGRIEVDELALDGRLVHHGRLVTRIGPLENGAHAVGIQIPGALFVRARVDPGPPLEVELTGELEAFELAWIVPALVEAEVDARLAGDLELRYARDPAELEGTLRLPELELSVAGQQLVAREPVIMRYQAGGFILEDLELVGPLGTLEAGGVIGPDAIDFLAFGLVDMSVLAVFVPQVVRSSGSLAVDLRAGGTLEEPTVAGSVNLVETIRLLPRGMLRDVVVESLFATTDGERVDLLALSGHVMGGVFTAEGSMQLDGLDLVDTDLIFEGESLPFRAGDLTGEVNTSLRLTSVGDRLLLSGAIDTVRGRYRQELAISGFSIAAPQPAVTPEPRPFMDRLDLDVRVTSLGALDVRADAGSFAVDLVLDADLFIRGTAAVPSLEGRIQAVRGQVETPQAELPIVRGVADFIPAPGRPIRAVVDVVAEGEILIPPIGGEPFQPTYFVSLVLEGEAEDMSLDLASQPPLDPLEILSLLVTGQVSPRLLAPDDQRHVESAMIFAGTRLAAPLTQSVADGLEDLLNIDVLIADVTVEGIAITAGAEVSRRLSLEGALQQGFGDAGALAAARAQFLLSNTVFLQAAAQAGGGNGGGLVPAQREGRRSTLEIRARVMGGG